MLQEMEKRKTDVGEKIQREWDVEKAHYNDLVICEGLLSYQSR